MALSAAIVWEVRATASDNNGGGFKTGATGLDYSQSDTSQATLTTASVVHTTTTQINVAAGDYIVNANDVGNLFNNTGGTATADTYEITAVDIPNNRWTVDKAVGTAGQTVAGKIGGARASLGGLRNKPVSGNKVWIKNGAYGIGNGTVNTPGNAPSLTAAFLYIEGYQAVRGDLGTKPILTVSTPGSWPANQSVIDMAGGRLSNIEIDVANAANARGIVFNGPGHAYRCIVRNCSIFTGRGMFASGDGIFEECLADAATIFNNGNGFECLNCVAINGGFFHGTNNNRGQTYTNCVAYKSGTKYTGAAGFEGDSGGTSVYRNCVAYNYAVGFNVPTAPAVLENCAAEGCTTGFSASSSTNNLILRNCAGYNNTTNVSANIQNNIGFIALTASPFTNAASGDFTLNSNNPGGAQLRGTGLPASLPTLTGTAYPDIGAYQHQDSGGGGSSPEPSFLG